MDEDEIIKSCTRLLEKGCTMLATHHDCGAPLFRCQGEVVCPVCSFHPQASTGTALSSGTAETEGESQREMRSRSAREDARPELDPGDEEVQVEEHLERVLLRKLKELTEDLEEEQDLGEMRRQLDCLDGLLKVFHSLHG